MGKLTNEIAIHASIEQVWEILADLESLNITDPTVKKATILSTQKTGFGAKRKVEMQDGKNWFDEEISVFEPQKKLAFQLTECTFPIHELRHTYHLERSNDKTVVRQIMEYQVKFGWLGRLLDTFLISKQFNKGIGLFLTGLKTYAEKA
jgi:ligand-binding SRPBCC domain-containing protein